MLKLSRIQKRKFYEDGYIILENIVPDKLIENALKVVKNKNFISDKNGNRKKVAESQIKNLKDDLPDYFSKNTKLCDLINKTNAKLILKELIGEYDPPTACHPAIQVKKKKLINHFTSNGYLEKDVPFNGSILHIDGILTIHLPQKRFTGDNKDIYKEFLSYGPKGYIGITPEVVGHNFVPLFQDPQMTLGIGSFTALVFFALTDQLEPGFGQTAVLPGAHHDMMKFLNFQKDFNNHVGIEGEGWPRLDYKASNGCGINYLPEYVYKKYTDNSSIQTNNHKKWPEPTTVNLKKGDMCIINYLLPHTRTNNINGIEDRINVFFRLRNKNRQPNIILNGVSDSPDRGFCGTWINYEDGNDPWEKSKYAMCNIWEEFEGINPSELIL